MVVDTSLPESSAALALSTLRTVIDGLAVADDLPSFLEHVLGEALRAAGTGHGVVGLIEGPPGSEIAYHIALLEGHAVLSGEAKRSRGIERLPFDAALRAQLAHVAAFDDGSPCTPDHPMFDATGFRAYLVAQGIASIYTMAMRVGGRMIGWLAAGYPAEGPLPADRLALLRLLADQMTIAVELTRLAERGKHTAVAEEKAQAAQLRAEQLARANRALTGAVDALAPDEADIGTVLRRMLRIVSEQIDSQASTLCMRADRTDTFRVEADYVGEDSVATLLHVGTHHLCPAPGNRLWGALIEERRCVVFVSDAVRLKTPDDVQTWLDHVDARTLLGVPLVQRGEVIGCFTFRFQDARRFSDEQLELLQTLAHQATLAVQMERLSNAAQSKSRRAATLAERARIARDLHDTLAQGLTGILMHLQASKRAAHPEQARGHVDEALDVARGAVIDARRSVHALRSITSERVDFVVTLKSVLATTFAGSSVALDVRGAADFSLVPEAAENELLRIAQEAATNALKHGRSTRFDAWVTQHGGAIELGLEDNGVGFDTSDRSEGFGLTGIEERAFRAGARLTLFSRPGNGTRITVTLPTALASSDWATP